MGGGSASAVGSGGMATKIAAAKIATAAGCAMAIAAGAPLHPVRRLEEGADCSWFLPASNPENARKQWIAGVAAPERCDHHRCGRAAGAALRQEPAARGRHRGAAAASSAATP